MSENERSTEGTEETEIATSFDGVVIGYAGHGLGSGLGSVLVGTDENAEPDDLPVDLCVVDWGVRESLTRGNGSEVVLIRGTRRIVQVNGDHRPCRRIAEDLEGQWVTVDCSDFSPSFIPHDQPELY